MINPGKIAGNQLVALVFIFLLGTSWLVPTGGEAKQDAWLVLLLATVWGLLVASLYVRLSKLFPQQTIIEILPKVLGGFLGKLIGLGYIFFFIHLTSLITRNMTDFFVVVLPKTPIVVFALTFVGLGAYATFHGLEVISRSLIFILVLVIILTTTATTLSIPEWNLTNLQPFLEGGLKPIIQGWFSARGFPFEEVVVFWMVFPYLNKQAQLRNKFYLGIILGGILIIIFNIRNLVIFGVLTDNLTYTSYSVMKYISVTGNERIEAFLMAIYFFSALGKLTITFYASTLGIAQLFNLKDYRPIILPLVLCISTLSIIVYDNVVEQFTFARKIYSFEIIPFSLLIPLLVLLIAITKSKLSNKKI